MTAELLTPKQVADMWGVNIRTVQAWVRKGTLPAKRLGGRWLIDPEDAGELLKSTGSTHAEIDAQPLTLIYEGLVDPLFDGGTVRFSKRMADGNLRIEEKQPGRIAAFLAANMFTPNFHVRYKTLHVPTALRDEFRRLLLDETATLKGTTRHIYLAEDEVHEDTDREDITMIVADALQMIVDALSRDGDISLSEITDKTGKGVPSVATAA